MKRFRPRIRSPAVIFSVAIVAIAVVALVGITAQPAPALTHNNTITAATKTVEQVVGGGGSNYVSAIEVTDHSLMIMSQNAQLCYNGQRAVAQPPAIASIRDIDYTAQSSRQDVAGIKKVDCFTADQRGQDVVAIRTSYTDTVSLSSRSIRL